MDMRSRLSPFERYHPLYRPMTRSTAVLSSALTSTALKLRRRWRRVRHCHLYVELLANPLVKGVEDVIFSREDVEVALPGRLIGYEPTST